MAGKKKKVNPRRIPVSMARLLKEREVATDTFMTLAIYCLMEIGIDAATIRRFEQKFLRDCSCLANSEIKVQDILKVLKKEYATKLEELDKLDGLSWITDV